MKQRKVWVDSALRDSIGETLLRFLSEDERVVMNFVSENGSVNVSQCQRLLSLTRWHNAKTLLMGMAKKKLLEHHKISSVERGASHFKIPKKLILAARKASGNVGGEKMIPHQTPKH